MMVQCSNSSGGELQNWSSPHQKAPPPPPPAKSKQKCECCPYGYHIDLDFVRYCETFNSKADNPSSKLRERRRQRQSMEVLLGITSPVVWQLEQQVPQVVEDEDPYSDRVIDPPKVYCDDNSASMTRDALNKAVLDFEETLLRTHKKTDTLDRNAHLEINYDEGFSTTEVVSHSYELQGNVILQRSPSTLSIVSSLSGDELIGNATHHGSLFRPSHDSDVASIGSAVSGVSTGALQLVREQMARSLEKMREMEDGLKMIPILQSQVNSLKEEKRLMMLQLKAGEAEKTKIISQMEEKSAEKSVAVNSVLSSSKLPASRSIGVECTVLTRDIGVSHQGPKIRSTSTQANVDQPFIKPLFISSPPPDSKSDLKNRLVFSGVKHETIASQPGPIAKKPVPKTDRAINTDRMAFRDKESSTDLSMQKIYTENEVEIMITGHEKKIKREEDALRLRTRVDKSVVAKPRCSETSVQAVVKVRDMGVSEHTLTDLLCDKCNVRKKSIGVGSAGSFLRATSPAGEDTLSLASLAMTRSKSSDHFNLRPKLRPMAAKETDTSDLFTFLDKGSNTNKLSKVDRGIGTKIETRNQEVSVMIEPTVVEKIVEKVAECKVCEIRKIEPPNTLQLSPSPTPAQTLQSRIPRLAGKSPVSPVSPTARRTFKRQDTYTKITCDFEQIHEDEVNESRVADEETAAKLDSKEELRLPIASTSTDDRSDEEQVEGQPLFKNYNPEGQLYTVTPQAKPRKKVEPSKEMRGAMKVMSDSLKRSPHSEVPSQLKNAVGIIQQEWFKISSTSKAIPLDVEDYLDCFEDVSNELLEHIVNMTDNSGNTAMHYAVSHGNFDVVSILLDSKVCNINQSNQAGYTSVMLVSLADVRSETDAQVVQRLFQLADVNVRAKQHGQTALMLAASHGKYAMATMLLVAGADVNIQDEDGSTALMCAAEHGHVDMVKLLLSQQDMDANVADHDGSTALNIAMEAGHRDVGVLLYAHQHFNSRSSSRTNSPFSTLKRRGK